MAICLIILRGLRVPSDPSRRDIVYGSVAHVASDSFLFEKPFISVFIKRLVFFICKCGFTKW